MLKKLSLEERVNQDFEKYKLAVSKVQNVLVKQQYETYLRDYQVQVNLIDEGHNTSNNGYIKPPSNRQNVERLVELRTKLESLL